MVSGSGSSWTVRNALNVGYSGSGTLSITNGGSVITTGGSEGCIGCQANSTGVVNVDGFGLELEHELP